MSADFFLDTNILVYSFDHDEPSKKGVAEELVSDALKRRSGVISWQVVQEFLNVALHKWISPMQPKDARDFIRTALLPLCSIYPSQDLWLCSLRIKIDHGLHFNDSMIVASAMQSGASILYSEDMQTGRQFGDLTIVNPFA